MRKMLTFVALHPLRNVSARRHTEACHVNSVLKAITDSALVSAYRVNATDILENAT